MMRTLMMIVLLLVTIYPAYVQQKEGNKENKELKIVYTGNMGVLLMHEDNAVIIDGFHKEYGDDYAFPPEQMVRELIGGHYKDLPAIDAALVTHRHGDHFDASYLSAFLTQNPKAIVMGAQQVTQTIEALPNSKGLTDRINTISYDGKVHTTDHNNIRIKAFRCNHVYPPRHREVQNIAYVITMGSYRVLHVGDTHWDVATETLKSLAVKNEALDIAVLPYWMLLEAPSKDQVATLLAPKQLIATHLPPNVSDEVQQTLRSIHPNIILLTRIGEEITYR